MESPFTCNTVPVMPCLQEIEAAETQIQRAQLELETVREEAGLQAVEMEHEVARLREAVQGLNEGMRGGHEGQTLLCLQDILAFKAVDEELCSALAQYWEMQVAHRPSSLELAEVCLPDVAPDNQGTQL